MNKIDEKIEALLENTRLLKRVINNLSELNDYIAKHEKSEYNPMYYIYYPAKASVIAAKIQLKGATHGLRVLEMTMHRI